MNTYDLNFCDKIAYAALRSLAGVQAANTYPGYAADPNTAKEARDWYVQMHGYTDMYSEYAYRDRECIERAYRVVNGLCTVLDQKGWL